MAVMAQEQITLIKIKEITKTCRYYLLQGSALASPTKPVTYPAPAPWVTSEPAYTAGSSKNLYFVDCTVYSDESFEYSEVSLSGGYEVAKAAYNTASNALDKAQEAGRTSQEALNKAGEAEQAASNASASAQQASASSAAAQKAAEDAQALVDKIEDDVSEMESNVASANEAAQNAQQHAANAETAASNAQTAASNAETAAEAAESKVAIAETAASNAQTALAEAKATSEEAKTAAAGAQATVAQVKSDLADAEKEIENLGAEIENVSNTMTTDYAKKTDVVSLESELQTQINQNATEISSTASRVDKVDETANNAAEQALSAQQAAQAAQEQASTASSEAAKAQKAADDAAKAAADAQTEANNAKDAATTAQNNLAKAEAELDVAKQNLESVTSRVGATEEEIAAASSKVTAAEQAAVAAKADAVAAAAAASAAEGKVATAQAAANAAKADAETAQQAASAAESKVAVAQTAASNAQAAANAAQANAETAASNASQAAKDAQQAAATAAAAQSKADTAKTAADTAAAELATAKANLEAVTSRVGATEADIEAAEAAVTAAQSKADQAFKDAATAQQAANTAKGAADAAQSKADQAFDDAAAAANAAQTAKNAADAAQGAADALAVRVTNAETSISQNADAIALRATKSEVANTLAGYYTKTETNAAITTKANEITSTVEKTYQKGVSRGEQLITNGNALLGNNTNFSSWTFDGAVSNNSPGSFTKASGTKNTYTTDEFFPVNTDNEYTFAFDVKSKNGLATLYSMLMFYDVDKNVVGASNHIYGAGSTTTLAKDLKSGDTVIYLTDASGWSTSMRYGFYLAIWNYKNSFGYTYPKETYTRNRITLPHASDMLTSSCLNKTANTLTLTTAYSGATIPAGTYVSQGGDGGTYKYFPLTGAVIGTEWKRYSGKISGVDYSGANKGAMFPPGTAYAKVGYLWNYNNSADQLWLTNVVVTDSTSVSAAQAAANKAQTDVNSLSTRVTQTEQKITSQATEISGLGTRMSTVEQTASGLTVSLQQTNNNVTNAQNTANEAKTTAGEAKTAASNAATVAGQASSTAQTAKSTADTAKSTADTAKSTADTAKSTADTASSTASTANSTANSASTAASNAQSLATAANTTANSVKTDLANNYQKKTLPDTRSTNQNPAWYISNYPKQIITEFKYCNVIGISNAPETYCALETVVPWNDSSGGYPKQVAKVGSKEYWRVGTSDTVWSAWTDASATATNYLNFSSAGLIIGDMTASALGNNVLIDSSSLNIRNGETILATFSAGTIELGKHSRDSKIELCGGAGLISATAGEKYTNRLILDCDEINIFGGITQIYSSYKYINPNLADASDITALVSAGTYSDEARVMLEAKNLKSTARAYLTFSAFGEATYEAVPSVSAGVSANGVLRQAYLNQSGFNLNNADLTIWGSTQSDAKGVKWQAINSKNPYIGYAKDQIDGTFVWSITGTNYASGLAIGGGSGNLLWKGVRVATVDDLSNINVSGYLPLSGGNISGHVYLTGSKASSSTGNTSQLVFGTASDNHLAITSNDNALVLNPSTTATSDSSTGASQIVLYLNKASTFPKGIQANVTGNLTGTASKATADANGNNIASTYAQIGHTHNDHYYTKTESKGEFVSWNKGAYDADTLYDAGIFMVTEGSNVPSGSKYGSLFTMPYRKFTGNTTADFGTQIFIPNGDDPTKPNSMFFRTSLSGTWNAWQEVATVGHTHNYLPLSGGTITGTSGDTSLYLQSQSTGSYLGMKNSSGTTLGFFGFNAANTPVVYIGATRKLLHEGNYTDYCITADTVTTMINNAIGGAMGAYY